VAYPRYLYADDHLHRLFQRTKSGQHLVLWMAYSEHAADRRNNPEVCMTSHGHVEDPASRRLIEVPGRGDPIQVYRFLQPTTGANEWFFYWHYTLAPLDKLRELTLLQRRYHLSRHQFASVSIEVFVPQWSADDLPAATEFVAEVDTWLLEVLPAGAVRGSSRLRIKPVGDAQIYRRASPIPAR